jgi:hypothetical protein
MKIIGVRVAPDELELVQAAAAARRQLPSTFARVATVTAAAQVPFFTAAEIAELGAATEQLRKVGQNLNTLLRDVELLGKGWRPGETVTHERIGAVMDAVNQRLEALDGALLAPSERAGRRVDAFSRRAGR